ncbi:MAG: M1 family aminopeptidase [Candidatus Sericytochromatia bacterium]
MTTSNRVNSATSNNYKIDVNINSQQRNIQGTNDITYYNNSKENLDKIYLLLGLNNNYDTEMKVIEVTDNSGTVLPSGIYRYRYLGREVEDKTIYQVSLPEAIPPGESFNLKVKFNVSNLTKINNILFLDDNLNDKNIGSWYPKVIHFSNGYWKKGDFPQTNFELDISTNMEDSIITSGVELSTDNNASKFIKKTSYKLNDSRSFAIAISPNLVSETDQTKEGTIIKSYYKSSGSMSWNKTVIENTKEIISYYNKKFGFYPYKQISIVPGDSYSKGAYANTNLIVLHDSLEKSKNKNDATNNLNWYLAYTIAQQYFGHLSIESGEYPKWITQGASLYLASSYLKEKNGKLNNYNDYLRQYIDASRANFNTKVLQPVNELEKFNFDWKNIIERGKSAQIFKMLEAFIGRKALQESLKDIVTKYQTGFIDTDMFEEILEKHYPKPLDSFFQQWVKENKKLDYAISQVKQEKVGNRYKINLGLKRISKAIMPVSISFTLRNGSKVFQVWDGNTTEATLIYEFNDMVKHIELDPANTLPDTDRTNNQVNVAGI